MWPLFYPLPSPGPNPPLPGFRVWVDQLPTSPMAWMASLETLDTASDLDSGFLLPNGFLIFPLAVQHKKVSHPCWLITRLQYLQAVHLPHDHQRYLKWIK